MARFKPAIQTEIKSHLCGRINGGAKCQPCRSSHLAEQASSLGGGRENRQTILVGSPRLHYGPAPLEEGDPSSGVEVNLKPRLLFPTGSRTLTYRCFSSIDSVAGFSITSSNQDLEDVISKKNC
ncbi:hypothetical protein AVEN_214041-1 [Araneus ventricosus]|uniref:Uncharacterized protein n=1 Tax=Araneus ventricosus TaxID=182803 RepID=A0A4Y2TJH4_ARAVE|nr:hypothetical protein AVEN_214041-1 [Araneus ventricosus]